MTDEVAHIWPLLKTQSLPYPPSAYSLVHEGLRHAVQRVFDEDHERLMGDRHVSGQELCLGVRDVAIEQFGPLARTVLETWHISSTDDFGSMVRAMVQAGLLRMSERDTLEDFHSVYDFDEAFGTQLDPSMN
ncbi:MAG: Minf_1886 family protein [Planctomycetota bacterium]